LTRLSVERGAAVEQEGTAGFVVACAHCGAELDVQGLALSLLAAMAASTANRRTEPKNVAPLCEGLRPREEQVLQLVAEGWRVTSIADRLGISDHTVRKHLQGVYRKVGVRSQAELVEWVHAMSESRTWEAGR
jgi:DNA-binding NarL/FixJ family response regulator